MLLATLAAVMGNLGLNHQKLAHLKSHTNAQEDAERSYVCDPYWIAGMLMVVVSGVCDMMALAFAAQSIVRLLLIHVSGT